MPHRRAPPLAERSSASVPDTEHATRERFAEAHPTFPLTLDTLSLLDQMRRHMRDAGVESFAETVLAAKRELAAMPEARARALGPRFWTKRLVFMANRALRNVGMSERWAQVKLHGDGDSLDPMWLLMTPADGRAFEALGIGRRVRPKLRFLSLPFLGVAMALGVLAYRRQTTAAVVLALAGYLLWFAASQVAARVSSGRSWRSP